MSLNFWARQALAAYPDKHERPDPGLWFATYSTAIDAAEGGSDIVALFRHLGIAKEYLYKTRDEIISSYPDRYQKYYKAVNLPTGGTGDFSKEGFDRAVGNVSDAWNKLYAGLTGSFDVAGLVKDWDLDTGVDMESPAHEVTYWA